MGKEDQIQDENLDGQDQDEQPDENEEGQDEQPDEQEPGDKPDDAAFDGEFDPKRARRTIDNLREQNKRLQREAAAKPKDADVQRENLQLKAALKLGVSAEFASRLRGDTVEEMIEDAGALLDSLGVKSEDKDKDAGAERAPRREPRPKLKGGSRPGDDPKLTPDQIVAQAIGN